MSSISMDIPTLEINRNELKNLIGFIYKHERLLKEFGALKIRPTIECKLAMKKPQKDLSLCPTMETISKIGKDELIYSIEKDDYNDESIQQGLLVTDEYSFWSSLSCLMTERRQLSVSLLPNRSFFSKNKSRIHFDIHRLPGQSLLKLGGRKVTRQFVPCLKTAHGPGSIFPLTCARQRLFSIEYHHEGGAHHWYIIPSREREVLRKIINHQNSFTCLDHGQLFIDPSVFDKNKIRYHRTIQHPNEFVVLSAGTLAQSFTEDQSWSESINFALPSWIEEGHADVSVKLCQCDIPQDCLPSAIDMNLFRHELIQRYINSNLNIISDNKSVVLKGLSLNLL